MVSSFLADLFRLSYHLHLVDLLCFGSTAHIGLLPSILLALTFTFLGITDVPLKIESPSYSDDGEMAKLVSNGGENDLEENGEHTSPV